MIFGFFKLDKSYRDAFFDAGTVGLQLVSCTVIGLAMGYYLDKWLDTRPWLTMVFLLLGIVAGFHSVYLDSRKILRRQKAEDERQAAEAAEREAQMTSSGETKPRRDRETVDDETNLTP